VVDGSLNGGVDQIPRVMRLGTDVVTMRDGLMIYGKFNQRAFDALRRRDLLDAFNRYCDTSRLWTGRPSTRKLVKRANRFLKRRGLPALEPLTFLEISAIQNGGDPPVGCLLARYRTAAEPGVVDYAGAGGDQ